MASSAAFIASRLFSLGLIALSFQSPIEEFRKSLKTQYDAAKVAADSGNFAAAAEALKKSLIEYNRLPEDLKKEVFGSIINTAYDMACYYSRAKDLKRAIAILKEAVRFGYKDYRHMSEDTDFDNIRSTPEFKAVLADVREIGDYPYLLTKAADYDPRESGDHPTFAYEDANDERLKRIAKEYNLDIVAGKGDDISKVLRLMRWVHLNANHDGGNNPKADRNAISLLNYAHEQRKGLNCRCMSITLNDIYQAAGFKSRHMTCMPKDPNDSDCHVIVNVYVPSLKKWVWMDPSFCAYMKDEKGNFLGVDEVRDRVINHRPIVVSPEINWNGRRYTAEEYLDYMSKNMYWFTTPVRSETDYESTSNRNRVYVSLLPKGFEPDKKRGVSTKDQGGQTVIYTSDPGYFWQVPRE